MLEVIYLDGYKEYLILLWEFIWCPGSTFGLFLGPGLFGSLKSHGRYGLVLVTDKIVLLVGVCYLNVFSCLLV